MIVNFLKLFTEYVGIVLCIYKTVNKKIKFNWISLFDFLFYMMLILVLNNTSFGNLVLYVYWFLYIRIRIVDTWKRTVKSFVIMMCVIPVLQLLIYSVISENMQKFFGINSMGLSVNILVIFLLLLWQEKLMSILINMITKYRKIIFVVLFIFLFKCVFSYFLQNQVVNSYFVDQLVICILIIALMLILWINSENEKKHKAEELRTYQLYTKTFEDAVATIRMKQHEFDNHINAIKCMRYTIQDKEELFNEQDKYCDKIMQDNRYNKLLKLNMSPILIGYLYSKFTAASTHGINVAYEIQDVDIECIAINDLIEIIGILFDNAVDALKEQGDTEMEAKLLKLDHAFIISIANVSDWKTNNEIEKFFEYGYSTKGKGHGVGLHRASTLLKKYKAVIQVENIMKNKMNFLCFKVVF